MKAEPFILVTMMSVLAFTSATRAVLVSHYTFDTDANDATGFRDAVLTSGASITADSQVGSGAVELSGGFVDLPGGADALNLSTFTITAWVNVDTDDGYISSIFSTDELGNGFLHINYENQLGYPVFLVSFGGDVVSTVDVPAAPTGWFHFALVKNGSDIALYIDGIKKSTNTVAKTSNIGNAAAIGSWNGDRLFDGRIDDFRIYDNALTPGEVAALAWDPNVNVSESCRKAMASGYTITGDLNGDCIVDLTDFTMLANSWLKRVGKPLIGKLGTIDCGMVETTPVVFNGRLYRFESVRSGYYANSTGDSYFRFIDVETGEATPGFAAGYHLGSAHVQDGTVYVYGAADWGTSEIMVFWSNDLETWSSQSALNLPGWGIYNNSVCRDADRYVMAFEVGDPPEIAGVRFTTRFAQSNDLLNWELMPAEYVYSKERYTACPALRFLDGFYYMIYLEALPGPIFVSHIVRTEDLISWESSPFNPVLRFSEDDRVIANSNLTVEQQAAIAATVSINNSDVDLCEYEGQVIINYSWGNQQGTEFLAEAVYEGSMAGFLRGWFPE